MKYLVPIFLYINSVMGFDPSPYKSGEFYLTVNMHKSADCYNEKMVTNNFNLKLEPLKSKVKFLGKIQKIENKRRLFIDDFAVVIKTEGIKSNYTHEALVKSGNFEFWISMPNTILSNFKSSIKDNDEFYLYSRYAGCVVTNEFLKGKSINDIYAIMLGIHFERDTQ